MMPKYREQSTWYAHDQHSTTLLSWNMTSATLHRSWCTPKPRQKSISVMLLIIQATKIFMFINFTFLWSILKFLSPFYTTLFIISNSWLQLTNALIKIENATETYAHSQKVNFQTQLNSKTIMGGWIQRKTYNFFTFEWLCSNKKAKQWIYIYP